MEDFKHIAASLPESGSNLIWISLTKAKLTAESRPDTSYQYFGGHYRMVVVTHEPTMP